MYIVMSNISFGLLGQGAAEKYLTGLGYYIVSRNVRCGRWGEIDIIAKDHEVLVFVEVKTRSSKKYGNPWESVGKFKIKALRRAVNYYVFTRNIKSPLRIDVVSVLVDQNEFQIRHFKNLEV